MTAPRTRLIDLIAQTHHDDFANDVRMGLTARPKYLPVKYLYDNTGSQLFEKITQQPDYYLPSAETAILKKFAPEIMECLEANTALVELGSGSATKTRLLIEALLHHQGASLFVPIDISGDFLAENTKRLTEDYPELQILGLIADYHDGLQILTTQVPQPKLIVWLGSDIGHLSYERATTLVRNQIVSVMNPTDKLLVGIDLKKSATLIDAAYGCTESTHTRILSSALACNSLHRINQQLQGNVVIDNFQYHCFYNEAQGRMEIYLKSLTNQQISIAALPLQVTIAEGELIQIHYSYKYNHADIQQLALAAGLQWQQQWVDEKQQFSLNLFSLTNT